MTVRRLVESLRALVEDDEELLSAIRDYQRTPGDLRALMRLMAAYKHANVSVGAALEKHGGLKGPLADRLLKSREDLLVTGKRLPARSRTRLIGPNAGAGRPITASFSTAERLMDRFEDQHTMTPVREERPSSGEIVVFRSHDGHVVRDMDTDRSDDGAYVIGVDYTFHDYPSWDELAKEVARSS